MSIKINEKLKKYSTFDPTKESKPESLRQICDYIEQGKFTLPIFQTYIRWTIDKSVELLNFQLFGKAAVSPISVNIIENADVAVPQISFLTRKVVPKHEILGKYSVNDGQQRLTCNYKAYTNHDTFRSIVLDISTGKFTTNYKKIKKNQIPVGILYNKSDDVFKDYLKENKDLRSFDVFTTLTEVRKKFMGYYYTVNYARDLTEKEQLEWFDVLNLAGSRVTEVEVHLTTMLTKGVDFYKEYSNKFVQILTKANMDNLIVKKATEVSIPLASLNPGYEIVMDKPHTNNFSPIPSDRKPIAISKLEVSQIRKIFSITLEGLENTIQFICDNKLIPERIDYLTYLVGLFVYNDNNKLNEKQKNATIKWFNEVDFVDKGNSERREIFEKLLRIKDLT